MELKTRESCSLFVDGGQHTRQRAIAEGRERRGSATLDEVELINRVAAKDGTAFETLYRGYYPRLRRFIERVTRRPQIVDEVVDDTMLVVWRKASTYNLRSRRVHVDFRDRAPASIESAQRDSMSPSSSIPTSARRRVRRTRGIASATGNAGEHRARARPSCRPSIAPWSSSATSRVDPARRSPRSCSARSTR